MNKFPDVESLALLVEHWLEEVKIQRVKRRSPAQRAKSRRYARKHKSRIKRASKMRRRKPRFKRLAKKRKAIQKRMGKRKLGPRRRLRVAGREGWHNLLENMREWKMENKGRIDGLVKELKEIDHQLNGGESKDLIQAFLNAGALAEDLNEIFPDHGSKKIIKEDEDGDKKVADYEIENYGVENSSYWQGAGTSFTDWEDVATGIGMSEKEAAEDALDQLASGGWDVSGIDISKASEEDLVGPIEHDAAKEEIAREQRKELSDVTDEEIEEYLEQYPSENYVHIVIYVKGSGAEESVKEHKEIIDRTSSEDLGFDNLPDMPEFVKTEKNTAHMNSGFSGFLNEELSGPKKEPILEEKQLEVRGDLVSLKENAETIAKAIQEGAVDTEEAHGILVKIVEYLDRAMEKLVTESGVVSEGGGAGVFVKLKGDVDYKKVGNKIVFSPSVVGVRFESYMDTQESPNGIEVKFDSLTNKEDIEDFEYRFGEEGTLSFDYKNDVYDPGYKEKVSTLVLSAGWFRSKYDPGDQFELSVEVDPEYYIALEGVAKFTESGADAFSDLDEPSEDYYESKTEDYKGSGHTASAYKRMKDIQKEGGYARGSDPYGGELGEFPKMTPGKKKRNLGSKESLGEETSEMSSDQKLEFLKRVAGELAKMGYSTDKEPSAKYDLLDIQKDNEKEKGVLEIYLYGPSMINDSMYGVFTWSAGFDETGDNPKHEFDIEIVVHPDGEIDGIGELEAALDTSFDFEPEGKRRSRKSGPTGIVREEKETKGFFATIYLKSPIEQEAVEELQEKGGQGISIARGSEGAALNVYAHTQEDLKEFQKTLGSKVDYVELDYEDLAARDRGPIVKGEAKEVPRKPLAEADDDNVRQLGIEKKKRGPDFEEETYEEDGFTVKVKKISGPEDEHKVGMHLDNPDRDELDRAIEDAFAKMFPVVWIHGEIQQESVGGSSRVIAEQDTSPVDRTVTVQIPLKDAIEDMGYSEIYSRLEEPFEIETHPGYTDQEIQSMNVDLPEQFDGADKYFPSAVGFALSDAESFSMEPQYVKAVYDALEQAYEIIDNVPAEYIGMDSDGNQVGVSTSAGIDSATIDQEHQTVTLVIKNPEHLINAMVAGEGYMAPDIPVDEELSDEQITKGLHWINKYFEIFGESKPEVDTNQISPDIDDDFFKEQLEFYIGEIGVEDAVDAINNLPRREDAREAARDIERITGGRLKVDEILKALG